MIVQCQRAAYWFAQRTDRPIGIVCWAPVTSERWAQCLAWLEAQA